MRHRTRIGGWATLATFAALAAFAAPSAAQVALTSDINPSIWAQAVTLTATVTPSSATGTVTFSDSLGATSVTFLGNVALSGGSAQLLKSNLFVGTHTLIARYNGDGTNAASTSPLLSQVVNRAPSTTGLTTNINPSAFGQNIQITATVTVGATGSVQFLSDGNLIGTRNVQSNGSATLNFSTLLPGTHSLTANYPGDVHYEPSTGGPVSQVVGKVPSTTALTFVPPGTVTCSQPVTLTASMTPNDATGTVSFTVNGGAVGSADVVGGVAQFDYVPVSSGTFSVAANYPGNLVYNGSTDTRPLTVSKATPTVTVSTDPQPSFWGQTITLSSSVSPSSASGNVTYFDSTTVLGTRPVGASLLIANLPVGTHTQIKAAYVGDGCFLGATSAFITHRVLSSATNLSVTTNNSPSFFSQNIKITATVLPIGATGRVGFRDISTNPATELGTAALNSLTGLASIFNDNLLPGLHIIQAYYPSSQPDNRYAPSASPGFNQLVEHRTSTVALTSTSNPSLVGQSVDLIATVMPSDADGYRPLLGESPPSMEFFEGATSLGSSPVDAGGVAILSVSTFSVGTHALTARYSGNFVYTAAVSPAYPQDVTATLALRQGASATITRLAAETIESGVRLSWAVANRASLTSLELQRAPAEIGPWNELKIALRDEAGVTVAEDRSLQPSQTYYYRVVGTSSGGAQAVYGPIRGTAAAVPMEFALSGAWPNPSKGAMTMAIMVAKQAMVRLSVVDLQGREVTVLADRGFAPGRYEIHWDGRTDHGQAPAGLYFVRYVTPEKSLVSRVAIAR